MNKKIAYVSIAMIVIGLLVSGCMPKETAKTEQVFEGGTATMTEDQVYWVLTLSGSWFEMGRQYGALAKEPLNQFFTEISADIEKQGMSREEQRLRAQELASGLSPELNQLLTGMAETSGLTKDEVLMLNAGMINLTGTIFSFEQVDACSGIAAWGDYTPEGQLIFGRNWDINREKMQNYMKYLAVVVFNPEQGHAFANIHPLGNVYLETGMNDAGIFIELNNGESSDPNENLNAPSTSSVLVDVLVQSDSMEAATGQLLETPADLAYIIQVADANSCVSVERATQNPRIRTADTPGLLAAYNNFVEPYPESWKEWIIAPPPVTVDPRYVNLIETANSDTFYGKLDLEGMKALMDLDVSEGGAVHDGTVFQYIAIPETKLVYIRGIDYSDWQQVDLKKYFQ